VSTKWTLTIEGIDLGTLIPTPEELQSHDYPLENWAAEVLGSLLGDLEGTYHERKMEALVALGQSEPEGGRVLQEALQAEAERNLRVIQYMRKHSKVAKVVS
jgi:hypothetical protein